MDTDTFEQYRAILEHIMEGELQQADEAMEAMKPSPPAELRAALTQIINDN